MKDQRSEIIRFVEPVFRFCLKRVNDRTAAEDLASEIMLHVLDGIRKYEINSLEAWVWRIAHNRYARYCEAMKKEARICSEGLISAFTGDYDVVDEESVSKGI